MSPVLRESEVTLRPFWKNETEQYRLEGESLLDYFMREREAIGVKGLALRHNRNEYIIKQIIHSYHVKKYGRKRPYQNIVFHTHVNPRNILNDHLRKLRIALIKGLTVYVGDYAFDLQIYPVMADEFRSWLNTENGQRMLKVIDTAQRYTAHLKEGAFNVEYEVWI